MTTADPVHEEVVHEQLRADDERWNALPFIGLQLCDPGRFSDVIVELRNCSCGSTLGRVIRRTTP